MQVMMGAAKRTMRHLALATVSLLVVASLAAYAVAPSGEAVAADAREEPARPGKEAIKGTAPRGTEIRVLKRTPNGRRPIAKRVVGASGRFSIEVRAGRY